MPKFNSISIRGYHMQEAGADPKLELAFRISDDAQYTRASKKASLSIDGASLESSLFFVITMNLYVEVTKVRSAWVLCDKRIKEKFHPITKN